MSAPNERPPSPESVFEAGWATRIAEQGERPIRWMGGRLRLLVGAALAGCVGVLLLARALAALPHLDAVWQATTDGRVELASSPLPALARHADVALLSVSGAGGATVALPDALALHRSARWLTDDAVRERHAELQAALAAAFADAPARLAFADGGTVDVRPEPRRLRGLGLAFWLGAALALALYLVGAVVATARPGERNLLYAAMAWCQAGHLLFIAVESASGLGLPAAVARWDAAARTAFDLAIAAAIVHAAAVHPLRLPAARRIACAAWGAALALGAALASGVLGHAWWWTQGALAASGAAACVLFSLSFRRERNPAALVLRRFVLLALATGALLTLALAGAERLPGLRHPALVATGTGVWSALVASLLLLLPFLSKPQLLMREFALLAVVTTVATSLDLLFVTAFAFGPFASVTLALFLTLGVYLGTRQWILSHLLGGHSLTAERTFARLYRTVREVEQRPAEMPALVLGLMRDLFEPLQTDLVDVRPSRARASNDGSTLLAPLPRLPDTAPDDGAGGAARGAVAMRFAQRGRRLFTSDDARLADRIVEQLRRALAFDRAVEQGRSEERQRLAQDLHDDIGARLLTLMYQAQTPEVEEYLRHTLQDLKTLTRGLAVSTHLLSDAAAEWKADLTQRLTLAQVALGWRVVSDRDLMLSVVQWSALTRVLRELVSNVIAHADARRVAIELRLDGERLELTVTDDGAGRDPAAWSHGLGLGGVRKRVKQLGGEVEWREAAPRGICCRVTVARF